MTKRLQFLAGAKDTLPILVGVAPFGMIYSVLAIKTGLSAGAVQAMSAFLFAGSAQIMIVQLVSTATPGAVIVTTAFIINLRHALYSASIAPHLKHLRSLWKDLLAFLLVDEAYAISITHYDRYGSRGQQHWYFLGSGLAIWLCFQASTAIGIFLGTQIPEQWSLDFTLALTFIALVIPILKDRPIILSSASAGITAVAAHQVPYKLGLILAAFVGIGVGLWSETKWQKSGSSLA